MDNRNPELTPKFPSKPQLLQALSLIGSELEKQPLKSSSLARIMREIFGGSDAGGEEGASHHSKDAPSHVNPCLVTYADDHCSYIELETYIAGLCCWLLELLLGEKTRGVKSLGNTCLQYSNFLDFYSASRTTASFGTVYTPGHISRAPGCCATRRSNAASAAVLSSSLRSGNEIDPSGRSTACRAGAPSPDDGIPAIRPCTCAMAPGLISADSVQPPTFTVLAGASPALSAPLVLAVIVR